MKYLNLRAKKPGEKDLEKKSTYKRQRLYEVREKELLEEETEREIPPDDVTEEE